MQLQLNINDYKASIFLEFLELFKKDNVVNDYKIIEKSKTYDDEVLEDLLNIGQTLKDAKNGLGYKTSKIVTIQDV